ncbi:MAG: hypothetical protein ACXVHS_05505 [Methanobacterium sp.]
MLKMEKIYYSLKCDVLYENKLIGHMEGVRLTQWFIKNKYQFKGSFSKFKMFNPEEARAGMTVDIIFQDKNLMAKNARIEWINVVGTNGTFTASKMEYYG